MHRIFLYIIQKNKRFVFLQNPAPIRLGPEQYVCPYCGKAMKSRAEMVRHIRIHTGEKPYICNMCNYKTNRKSSLDSHVYRIHRY